MMHYNVSGFRPLMAELSTNYEGAWGLHAMHKRAPGKNYNIKVWYAVWLKKVLRKKIIQRKRRKL